MRMANRLCFGVLFFLGFSSLSALGQTDSNTARRAMHVADGGMNEVLESIVIPSTAHAPFYATLDTVWERPLVGGGTYTFQNERHIARDSAGRIYQERWFLVPKNGKAKSEMNYIQVDDPVSHIAYTCSVFDKVCTMRAYHPPAEVTFESNGGPDGVLPNDWGFVAEENIGRQTVAGVETVGLRRVTTINPWTMGNDRPMTIIREYWHSAALDINLLSTLTDPRLGTQTFTIREISTSEPDAQLFLAPAGYKVVDQRSYAPPVH